MTKEDKKKLQKSEIGPFCCLNKQFLIAAN
jgi:hypothetical protein